MQYVTHSAYNNFIFTPFPACETIRPKKQGLLGLLWFISIIKPTRCINVSNLFYWSNTLHVSDGLSVHHQELKTVHTATGIYQIDTADWLLVEASSWQYLLTYACCSLYSL